MNKKNVQFLDQNWQFMNETEDKWYDAIIPGCIHLDLFQNQLIPNPFKRDNEKKLQWIGEKNWTYRCDFMLEEGILNKKNQVIYFEGIDTYADIFLNEEKILSPNNMFHPWKAGISNLLKDGKNELKICFRSPIEEVSDQMGKLNYLLPADNDQAGKTSPYTRKAPYHYGWDWGPCFVTSGIWRRVCLSGWDSWYVEHSSIVNTTVTPNSAQLAMELEVFSEISENAIILIEEPKSDTLLKIPIRLKKGGNFFREDFSISDPDLWWPSGHGDQPLYTFRLSIESNTNHVQFSKRIGIRDVSIKRERDEKGKSFEIYINGKPIFSKGANWIPADSFTTRIQPDDYKRLIATARDANMNTLRIWGGGIYEPDIFYELCDEMGIMVWQDFMFACSMYPAHQEFLASVKREAEYQVKRLKSHPSIILWCGNNEIASGWLSWGWKEELPSSVWDDYKKIFHDLLPNVCKKLDPGRLYWPSSPGHSLAPPESDQIYGSGDNHYWGVWHGGDGFDAFEENIGRFLSEYGMQSFPEMGTIMKFAEEKDLDINSKVMKERQKASLGTGNLVKYIEDYFPPQKDFQAIVVLSQVMQAFAIKKAVETHRRSMPFCMGTLYWQFNDCWPAISWSSVDYFGNWKALHYHAKRFFNEIIIVVHEEGEHIHISVVNDQHKTLQSRVKFQLSAFNGSIIHEKKIDYTIAEFSSSVVYNIKKKKYLKDQTLSNLFIHAEINEGRKVVCKNKYFFVPPKDLNLPDSNFNYVTKDFGERISIQIQASTFIYQLYITCNNADGVFSDNYFDLGLGETVTIYFTPLDNSIDSKYDFSLNTAMDIGN